MAQDTGRRVRLNLMEVVEKIRDNDPSGLESLYTVFSRGVRFYLWRQLGSEELDDKVHDTFLIVVQAIQKGELREPARLMGFVRTVVRRQAAAQIERLVQTRAREAGLDADLAVTDANENLEENLIAQQQKELMIEVLQSVSSRDREILTRFYLEGECQEKICRDMNLTETQFRLLKSRAKVRFGELGKKKLKPRRLPSLVLRLVAGLAD